MQSFTNRLKPVTRMLPDASVGGTMKIKMVEEVKELIDNIYLNEYHPHTNEEVAPRKERMSDLNTHDALIASNKLLSIKLETIPKRLDARDVAQL